MAHPLNAEMRALCSASEPIRACQFSPKTTSSTFLRRQVLTSRNVRGGRFIDFALGGLNYQIEHHLFPSMPRPSLRRSQALIRAFCDRNSISYQEDTLVSSYAQSLRYLNDVGAMPRADDALTMPRCGASRA